MTTRNRSKFILVGAIGLFFCSCFWPSRTIHTTYFVEQKGSGENGEILLAQKDSLSIYAKVSLADWDMLNSIEKYSKEYDSVLNAARENCKLNIGIYTNNKGTVTLDSFDIQAFDTQNQKSDHIKFTEFCKRKEWDLICYKTKEELLASLQILTFDNYVSSQLLLSQGYPSATLFGTKEIYVKIKLKLNYNNWKVDINYSDTLNRVDKTKEYALHP